MGKEDFMNYALSRIEAKKKKNILKKKQEDYDFMSHTMDNYERIRRSKRQSKIVKTFE